jgi:hypothetical protein
MTIDTAQYTQFFQQGQDALRTSVETWTNTVKTVAAQFPALTTPFDADAAVDRYFELSEKVLEAQRDLAKKFVSAGAAVAETVKA